MITIKNAYAQERMVIAGRLLAELFERLREWIEAGMYHRGRSMGLLKSI